VKIYEAAESLYVAAQANIGQPRCLEHPSREATIMVHILYLAPLLRLAYAIPIYTGTCAPVSAIVTILNVNKAASTFCSSFLPITTATQLVTSTSTAQAFATITSTTGTNVHTGELVVVAASTSTIEVPTSIRFADLKMLFRD
jgi:hypothetical protein